VGKKKKKKPVDFEIDQDSTADHSTRNDQLSSLVRGFEVILGPVDYDQQGPKPPQNHVPDRLDS